MECFVCEEINLRTRKMLRWKTVSDRVTRIDAEQQTATAHLQSEVITKRCRRPLVVLQYHLRGLRVIREIDLAEMTVPVETAALYPEKNCNGTE